eukprot:scaffold81569_cov19-Tisochrysis_lutea.AAC.1
MNPSKDGGVHLHIKKWLLPDLSGGQPMDPKIAAILAAAGRTAESFPPDFAGALLAGRVGAVWLGG